MGRLVPRQAIEEIGLKPERDVARALVEKLPKEVVVYHGYPWLRAERNDRARADTLREVEADFVVVDPHRGILILEVKGGMIEYDSRDHTWSRLLNGGRRRQIQDPFEQARKNTGPSKASRSMPSS